MISLQTKPAMKKLITILASIPITMLSQQFPEAPMYFYVLKNAIDAFICKGGYKTLLAMDMKTHAAMFSCDHKIVITKVGYRAWKPGITYTISFWEYGKEQALASCIVTPQDTEDLQFFPLDTTLTAYPNITYYISRTYISGGPNQDMSDYIGWLNNKNGTNICPLTQHMITLSNGFFSDDINPLNSVDAANITTNSFLPIIDFEYALSKD